MQLLAAIDRVSGSAADAADENAQRYVNAYRGAVQGLAEEVCFLKSLFVILYPMSFIIFR